MIRKYHNHTTQKINPWYHKEKPKERWLSQDIRNIVQSKQSALSSPTRLMQNWTKQWITQQGPNTEPLQTWSATINTTSTKTEPPLENGQPHKLPGQRWDGGGGLNAFYGYQICAQNSVVVKTQNVFSSHRSF